MLTWFCSQFIHETMYQISPESPGFYKKILQKKHLYLFFFQTQWSAKWKHASEKATQLIESYQHLTRASMSKRDKSSCAGDISLLYFKVYCNFSLKKKLSKDWYFVKNFATTRYITDTSAHVLLVLHAEFKISLYSNFLRSFCWKCLHFISC